MNRNTHVQPEEDSTLRHIQSRRAANEDADVEMTSDQVPSESARGQMRVELPRRLRRAAPREISRAALETVDPRLKNIGIEPIRERLESVGQQLLSIAVTTITNPPRNRLPTELEVMVNDITGDPPTHIFAVYSRRSPRVTIHPVHALVFVAHCANLPSLPYSRSVAPTEVGRKLTLPVFPLGVPHADTFSILLRYIYTKQGDNLLASLLLMPPRDEKQSANQLAHTYAETFTVRALKQVAAKVYGFWSNVAALGVYDEKLWRAIDFAWEVLLDALAISTGSTWQTVGPEF